MTHPYDELLPNSRAQSLKLLLLGKQLAEPWYVKLARVLSATFSPIWRAR